MRGYVYVLSNKAMPGLVKIGFTNRTIAERLSELNSTGVPTSFVCELYFDAHNAQLAERVIHHAFRKYHFEKEFFKIPVVQIVKYTKQLIEEGAFDVYEVSGKAKDLHLTQAEQDQLRSIAKLQKARDKELKEKRDKIELEVNELATKFLSFAPKINDLIRSKSVLGTGSALRNFAAGALGVTLIFSAIADKISPPAFDDGMGVAVKLTKLEIELIREFHVVVGRLVELNEFSKIADAWRRKSKPNDFLTRRYDGNSFELLNTYTTSQLLKGVFSGLKLAVI